MSLPSQTPSRFRSFLGAFSLAVLVLAGFCLAPAAAAPPTYRGSSSDGEVVFFESEEQLVPGDTDNKRDLYERSFDKSVGENGAYVTREVSVGPTGGNDAYNVLYEGASADGNRVFFSTEESLVAADTDRETDVYVRELSTGTTRLVSRGAAGCLPGCGNGEFGTGFAGASGDGNEVFLVTAERLDPAADTDGAVDVYMRNLNTETTTLVSSGATACLPGCGNGSFNATLRGVSADGSTAFFATAEPLQSSDTDEAIDIYARTLPGGPTTLVSAGSPACSPCGNNSSFAAIFAGSSANGSKVFFETAEGLVPTDTDGANDIYERSGGVTTLVSAGTAAQPASFVAAPGDGSRVFYVTAEAVVEGDVNGANDVYMYQGGAPQLITSGNCCGSTFAAVSADAQKVFFTTTESLAAADEDESADIYEQDVSGGAPVLVSQPDPACSLCGLGEAPARFNRASADGERVFFTTDEPLSGQDFDEDDDIYARDLTLGTTTLETPPPGLCPTSDCDATFVAASSDATHVFFQTEERLVAEDVDSEPDIYERAFDPGLGAEVTRLVSTGNDSGLELGPPPPQLEGTSPGSPGESTQPSVIGQAQAESLIKIYPTSSCSGEPVATGTAAELAAPGIAVGVAEGTTKSFWATAEAEGFTSLCSNPVTYTQQSAPPPTSGGSGVPPSGEAPPPTHDGVPYVAPLAKITFGPGAKTRLARPVFRFADATGQPGTSFKCKVDRGRWARCTSPFKLKRLKRGRHVFSVQATNAVGTPGPRPVSRSFKVVSR